MNARDMDDLVAIIADRVKARITQPGSAAGHAPGAHGGDPTRPQHHHRCVSCKLPLEACSSCGLNPANAIEAMPPTTPPDPKGMARFIDHTLLKATAQRNDIQTLCQDALRHRFWSVCVNSANVRLAASLVHGSSTKVCAVVGFPLGAGTPGAKAFEAREAVRCGADEIDMVLNIGALRSRDYALVVDDIQRVVRAVPGKLVKVILETAMLTQEQKLIACGLAKVAGAHFVKTSTGFGPGGATLEDVALMRGAVGPDMGVKASGGVRSYADAVAMLQAGANRIGASSSVGIVTGAASSGKGY